MGVNPEEVEAVRLEPDEVDRSKSEFLHVIAEGKPYMFITMIHGDDHDGRGEYVGVQVMTSIGEGWVIDWILDTAKAQLASVVDTSMSV